MTALRPPLNSVTDAEIAAKPLYTCRTASEYLSARGVVLSPSRVRGLAWEGKLPHDHFGRDLAFSRVVLDNFIAGRRAR